MRGRKAAAMPRVRRDIRLRQDLISKVDLILMNPTTHKVRYGKWADLVEALLDKWIDEVTSTARPIDQFKVKLAFEQLVMPEDIGLTEYNTRVTQAMRLLAEALNIEIKEKKDATA